MTAPGNLEAAAMEWLGKRKLSTDRRGAVACANHYAAQEAIDAVTGRDWYNIGHAGSCRGWDGVAVRCDCYKERFFWSWSGDFRGIKLVPTVG